MGGEVPTNGSGTNGSLRSMDKYLMEKIDKLTNMGADITAIKVNQENLTNRFEDFIRDHKEMDDQWVEKVFVPVKNQVNHLMKYYLIATGAVGVLILLMDSNGIDALKFWFHMK